MGKVNSEGYWDDRFKDDWVENHGDKQSQFFMDQAFDLLPAWLNEILSEGKKTVCDWGCAEGDGTSMLAKRFPKTQFTGIDFADTAIAKANKKYNRKNLSFEAIDLLTQKYDKKFDIIFSSNVFEHFDNPWKTFDKVSSFASDVFIMMVPYKEDPDNLISEHFHSFNEEEFHLNGEKWDILHFATRDTSKLPETYWFGNQALVVFVSKEFNKKFSPSLANVMINPAVQDVEIVYINPDKEKDVQIETMTTELESLRGIVSEYERVLTSKRVKLANKVADAAAKVMPLGSRRRRLVGGVINKVTTRSKK